MAEERLRRNLEIALDPGSDFPGNGWLSRTMAALERQEAVETGASRRPVASDHRLGRTSRKLIAAVAIVALGAALAGAFVTVNQYAHRVVPVTEPHPRTGPLTGTTVASGQLWAYSPEDAAVAGGRMSQSLFVTHDGGATWRTVDAPADYSGAGPLDVRWIDSNNLVVVYGQVGINVTTDGGVHWRATRSSSTQDSGNLPFFLNATEGWQIAGATQGSPGLGATGLLHTSDGGAHWTAVPSSLSFKQFDPWVASVVFSDSENGFLIPGGSSVPWATRDGGRSWSQAVFSPPSAPASQSGYPLQGPFMFGKKGVVGFQYGATTTLVYSTNDGGFTWSGPRSAPGLSFAALDLNTWWVVDGDGHLYRTSDGGDSWDRIQTDLARNYFGMLLDTVTPVSNSVLWGTADDTYAFVRSIDGGAHWSFVKVPAS